MQWGIAIPTAADSWKIVQRAEELGFSHAWFYDTQMLSADCFVAMGAAAVKTSRIRLGTGVLIPSNRIAPVTANALATLNHLAPGRIDFGVGTGFTGRRAMGFGPMKMRAMEIHIEQIYGLLRDEVVELEMEGERRKIKFLNADLGLINTRDPIKLHLSAFGPRTRALTAKLNAGWIEFANDVETASGTLQEMQTAWRASGRTAGDLETTLFAVGCVLQPGEPADSARALAQGGLRAAVMLHAAADTVLSGMPARRGTSSAWQKQIDAYVEMARGFEPKDAPWIKNHRGHLMFIKPDERPLITANMVRATSFTASEPELKQRIEALGAAGYSQFAIQMVPGQEKAIEDWARIKKAFDR